MFMCLYVFLNQANQQNLLKNRICDVSNEV